ncbi:MAG: hypothetical protein KF760_29190 [Candidatus Eremiobacteraeota bacterium]|nr:hypothetical protein [Candidatus Eremiobacteraeota bacterium]MCW5865951.1 hypothetical protein [Candidatus Eremiobacteraeota bacterium]
MATQRFWEDSPLAALTRVRARRQLQDLPGWRLWPPLAATLSYAAWNWLEPTHYTALLTLTFLALFMGLPAYLNGRDLAHLRSLRQGRCLEEMLAVGLTPKSVADTLAWSSWSLLARLTSLCWLAAVLPPAAHLTTSLWLALPLGLGLMALTVYLRQVLLLLADDPGRLLRQGLRVYGQACLCLAPPVWVAAVIDFPVGGFLLLLGTGLLLIWVRRRAVDLWRADLDPHKSARAVNSSWGAWLIPWVSNPILIRELRSSRGHSLFLWLLLPVLVLGSVGLALPPMVRLLGPGLGFFSLWLGWRMLNHSVLAQRSRELVQNERQGGSWELLVQVGLGGPQFVQGWAQATAFRHFGWMLADLLGLLALAFGAPQWMLPAEMASWAPLWALSLWGLGLLMDWAAFMAGLAGQTRSLLPAWAVATGLGELALVLAGASGWLAEGPLHTFLWSQGLPALGLLTVLALSLGQAYRALGPALDPVRGAGSTAVGLDLLPRRVAQASWCVWLLTTPSLEVWRFHSGWLTVALTLAGGALVWGWLMQPLAWAVGNNLHLRRGHWLSPLCFGQLIAWLSAIPVALAVEARNLYWLSTGSTWFEIQHTTPAHDLPMALAVASVTALAVQLQRVRRGETMEPSRTGLRLAALGAAGLCLGGATLASLNKIYPSQMTPAEQRWWNSTSRYQPMSVQQWNDQYSAFYDELGEHRWVKAVDRAIELERARLGLQLKGYSISGSPMSELLETLSTDPPTDAAAEEMVRHLEAALKDPQELAVQDAEMRRSLESSRSQDWWAPALQVAQLREYRRRNGHLESPPPGWVKHHPAFYPNIYAEVGQMQAEMAVLNHRLRMRLGDKEWPSFFIVSPSQVMLVTRDGEGYTDYWLARAGQSPVTIELENGRQRKVPAVHVACVTSDE